MASYEADPGHRAVHDKTLVAATEDTVTLGGDFQEVDVINLSGADELYCTADGSDAAVGGGNCFVVPAVAGASIRLSVSTPGDTVVRVISAGAPSYSVVGR